MIRRGAIFIGAQKDDFISETIRSTTHSNWSHVAIILDSTEFDTYVFGARGLGFNGVDICTLSEYDKNMKYYYRVYNVEIDQSLIDCSLQGSVMLFQGKLYGYLQLIGFWIWFKLKEWFGITLKHIPFEFWTVCSELASDYIKPLLPDLTLDWDSDKITPQDFYAFMENNPEIFKLVKTKDI